MNNKTILYGVLDKICTKVPSYFLWVQP